MKSNKIAKIFIIFLGLGIFGLASAYAGSRWTKTQMDRFDSKQFDQRQESEKSLTVTPTDSESNGPTITLQITPRPSISGGCVITLFGRQYDVAPLRRIHPGGDIFACGTDMTDVYTSKHGTNTNRVAKYLLGAGGSNTNSGSSFRSNGSDEEDDD